MKKLSLFVFTVLTLSFFSCTKIRCSDGKQGKKETGVDCGGPCPSCNTCHDGVQNQDETGIDCGGLCSICPTCTDGILNQGETGIDCGGPCGKCPITYPRTGYFSINILQPDAFSLFADQAFHVKADLPANTSVKVHMRNTSAKTPSLNTWITYPDAIVGWSITPYNDLDGTQSFSANGNNLCDMRMFCKGHGSADVRIYENGATLPTVTKTVTW